MGIGAEPTAVVQKQQLSRLGEKTNIGGGGAALE